MADRVRAGWGTIAAGLVALGACRTVDPVGSVEDSATPQAPPPNLLVILTDDQGVDMVSGWGVGADPPATPRIDSLIETGVRFTQAWANPTCSPTRAALLTGRYGRRTGVGSVLFRDDPNELPLSEQTFAEALQQAPTPYATAAVGKWHLSSPVSPSSIDHPNLQGFDTFAGSIDNLADYQDWIRVEDGQQGPESGYATTVAVDDALARIAALPEPWVMYVAFHAPHGPWSPPPAPLNGRGVTADDPVYEHYRAMVEALDTELGRLVDGLGEQRKRTVVTVLSDNGTPQEVTDPIIPGKNTPTEAGLRVPLVVNGPGIPSGQDCDVPVHVVDVFPTLLELAGATPGPERPLHGMSLVPWLYDPRAPSTRAVLYSEKFIPNGIDEPRDFDWRILRDERYKLVEKVGSRDNANTVLVDLWSNAEDNLLNAEPVSSEALEARDRLVEALAQVMDDLQSDPE